MNKNPLALLIISGLATLLIMESKTAPLAEEPVKKPKKKAKKNNSTVSVYKNLNKDCYSIKNDKTKRVEEHSESVVLKNATFKVSEAGRKRVLKTKHKNVHAFVQGEKQCKVPSIKGWKKVTYDPYKYSSFVEKKTEIPIIEAEYVVLKPDGVYVKP